MKRLFYPNTKSVRTHQRFKDRSLKRSPLSLILPLIAFMAGCNTDNKRDDSAPFTDIMQNDSRDAEPQDTKPRGMRLDSGTRPDADLDGGPLDIGSPDAGFPDVGVDAGPIVRGLEIVWWKFDQTGGNAIDSSGNGFHGTNNGNVAYEPGKIGNAARIRSPRSYYTSLADSINNLPIGSIAIWFKGFGARLDEYVFIHKGNTDIKIGYQSRPFHRFYLLAGTVGAIFSDGSFQGGKYWDHHVFTWDGMQAKYYLNGVHVDTQRFLGGAIPDNRTKLIYVGSASDDLTYGLVGLLDDFRVYGVVLSPAEVNLLHNNGQGTTDSIRR